MCGEEVFNKWFKPAEDWFLIILPRKNACMYIMYFTLVRHRVYSYLKNLPNSYTVVLYQDGLLNPSSCPATNNRPPRTTSTQWFGVFLRLRANKLKDSKKTKRRREGNQRQFNFNLQLTSKFLQNYFTIFCAK